MTDHQLADIYQRLREQFGHQQWWPGETSLEICLGAILTQHTQWQNVERAITNLRQHDLLQLVSLEQFPEPELAELIRPAGCYRVKAKRIKAFVATICDRFQRDLAALFKLGLPAARKELLAIHGIGPETADCMLLYAGNLPSFVVDAYTLRIFSRHHWIPQTADYNQLKALCERGKTPPGHQGLIDYWQDFHAQIVAVGKTYCHTKEPNCAACPLQPVLADYESHAAPLERTDKAKQGAH